MLLAELAHLEAARASAEFNSRHILEYLQQEELHPIERENMSAWLKIWLGSYQKVDNGQGSLHARAATDTVGYWLKRAPDGQAPQIICGDCWDKMTDPTATPVLEIRLDDTAYYELVCRECGKQLPTRGEP